MKKKIMLIDDDVDFVEQNSAFLEKNDYNVVYAYNGKDGLKLMEQEKPDLLVLDVMMNEVGEGFEVARLVRQREELKDMPIIMLSSVNKVHGFNLTIGPDENWNPVNDFLDKPVDHKLLLEKIERLLYEKETAK